MAGPKQSSSLPAKKSKAKSAKSATVPKPSLSAEFVVDSDDSGDTETASEKAPALETASSKSNTVQQAASKSSTSQGKPSKKRKLPSSSPAEDSSGGSEGGKHSSNENEKRPTKKRILTGHNERLAVKPKPATAPTVLAKPSMKPSTNIKPLNKNKQRVPGGSGTESDSETEKSSYESSTGSESSSGKESTSRSSDKTSLQSPGKENSAQKGVPQQSTPSYEPPDGFEPTTISLHPASTLSDILAPSNLHGKQIWHITVPEPIPISSIKEVPLDSIRNGASIVEHHGAKYGLVPDPDAEQRSNRALLLPSIQTNNYQPSKANIVKTLHLQQLVSIPRHVTSPGNPSNRLASPSDSYRKTPRQQPEGLRTRYRPFGASDGSDVESTPEPMPKAPEFRIPDPVRESSAGKKRKRHESIDSSSNAASTVKSKKRKKGHQATAGAIEDAVDIDAISAARSNRAESSSKDSHEEPNRVKSKGNIPNGTEMKKEGKNQEVKGSSGTKSSTSISKREKEKAKPEKRKPPSQPATALLPLDVRKDAETIQPGEVVEGIPATANAVEGTTSINVVSSTTTRKDEKAKRKEERRRRKEMERAGRGPSSLAPPPNGGEEASRRDDDDGDQIPDRDQLMTEIENAQREAEIPVDDGRVSGGSGSLLRVGSGDGGMTEMDKEEEEARRRKRKEKMERREKKKEERRRKMEGSYA